MLDALSDVCRADVVDAVTPCEDDTPPFREEDVSDAAFPDEEPPPDPVDEVTPGRVMPGGQMVTVTTEVPGVMVESDKENDGTEAAWLLVPTARDVGALNVLVDTRLPLAPVFDEEVVRGRGDAVGRAAVNFEVPVERRPLLPFAVLMPPVVDDNDSPGAPVRVLFDTLKDSLVFKTPGEAIAVDDVFSLPIAGIEDVMLGDDAVEMTPLVIFTVTTPVPGLRVDNEKERDTVGAVPILLLATVVDGTEALLLPEAKVAVEVSPPPRVEDGESRLAGMVVKMVIGVVKVVDELVRKLVTLKDVRLVVILVTTIPVVLVKGGDAVVAAPEERLAFQPLGDSVVSVTEDAVTTVAVAVGFLLDKMAVPRAPVTLDVSVKVVAAVEGTELRRRVLVGSASRSRHLWGLPCVGGGSKAGTRVERSGGARNRTAKDIVQTRHLQMGAIPPTLSW